MAPNEWKYYHFRFAFFPSLSKNRTYFDSFYFCTRNMPRKYCQNVAPQKENISIWCGCVNPSENGRCNKDSTIYTELICSINLINFQIGEGTNTSIKINVTLMLKWVLKLFQMSFSCKMYNHAMCAPCIRSLAFSRSTLVRIDRWKIVHFGHKFKTMQTLQQNAMEMSVNMNRAFICLLHSHSHNYSGLSPWIAMPMRWNIVSANKRIVL